MKHCYQCGMKLPIEEIHFMPEVREMCWHCRIDARDEYRDPTECEPEEDEDNEE